MMKLCGYTSELDLAKIFLVYLYILRVILLLEAPINEPMFTLHWVKYQVQGLGKILSGCSR